MTHLSLNVKKANYLFLQNYLLLAATIDPLGTYFTTIFLSYAI